MHFQHTLLCYYNIPLTLSPLRLQHVPGTAGEAVIQGYNIQSSQEGESNTTCVDTEQCQAAISIGPGQCEVTVQATLLDGYCTPAHITIPPVQVGGTLCTI